MDASALLQGAQQAREQLLGPGAPFELETVQHLGHAVRAYKKAFASLPELIGAGRAHGDREFIVYGDQRWTFARFFAAVDALAGQLQHRHTLKPGERVALAMRNCPEWAVAFAAVALVGGVPVPLNSFGLGEELSAGLRDIQPRLLIGDQARHDRLPAGALPSGCDSVVIDGSGGAAWAELTAAGGPTPQTPALAPTDPAAVPLFHVSGLHAQLLLSLRHGRRLVFMHRWDPAQALQLIRAEKVTQFNGAPSMVQQLLDQAAFHDPAVTGSLMGLGFGGAGLSQKLIDATLAARPQSLSGIGFGLTETNGVGSAVSGQLFAANPHCAGLVSPLMEIRIVDAYGRSQPDGERGEVWLRGVTVMDGYWNRPEATRSAVTDGWFHSGDVGVIEAGGLLRIVDRIKDVINRNGEKIAAAEVESCLLQHPDVDEAAVFAQADEQTGEAVVAVVHLRAGSPCTAAELQQHVGRHLAAYKVPQAIHLRSEALPRNPAGKLLKSVLRQAYAR